jgi:hypothetical protein
MNKFDDEHLRLSIEEALATLSQVSCCDRFILETIADFI